MARAHAPGHSAYSLPNGAHDKALLKAVIERTTETKRIWQSRIRKNDGKAKTKTQEGGPLNWSGKGDSNSRPSPWQGDALPLSYSRNMNGITYGNRLQKPVKATDGDNQMTASCEWRPIGGSNPCSRRERAVSWTTRRMGHIYTQTTGAGKEIRTPDPRLGKAMLYH